MIRPLRRLPALALLLAACGGSPGAETAPAPAAAPRNESAAFVVTIGTDTVSVERYTRTATTLSGEVITRSPRTTSRVYTARLRPDGSVSQVEITARQLTAAPSTPPTVTSVSFAGDTAAVRIVRGDSVQTQRVVAGANAFPLVGGSYAIYEQAIMHARAAGATDTRVRLVAAGNPQPVNVELRGVAGDSLQLVTLAGPASVRTDATGRILAVNAPQSTQKIVLQRLPSLDVAGLGASFAQREAAGRGLGTLSPRDSVTATVGGARVVIDYGRPLTRGRRVLGEVVPLNEVWRTGANAATGLRTDRDLVIGGTRVPAGAYTLFSLPSESGWQLIVNRQTGQWGTEYRPEQDLARIPLQRRAISPAVEQFTIRIGPDGTLRMLWDDFELSAPIEAR
jgi:hypothetical protein